MSEKVIFEFRVDEKEDGYTYVFKHDKEALGEWGPSLMQRFLPSFAKGVGKRLEIHRNLSKRRMRRRLDFFEKVYEELYSQEDEEG